MFGNHQLLERKLRKTGVATMATVVAARASSGGANLGATTEMESMMARMPRPSLAGALALIALFVALGGTSYAVVDNAIASGQGPVYGCVNQVTGMLRIVTSIHACHRGRQGRRAERLIAFSRTGPQGPPGRPGPPGPASGAAGGALSGAYPNPSITPGVITQSALAPGLHVASAATASDSASLGGAPAAAYLRYGTALASGQSESGDFAINGDANAGADPIFSGITFNPPLAIGLDIDHVNFLNGFTTPTCPGVGTATPGNLCVYINATSNTAAVSSRNFTNGVGTDPWGADLYALAAFSGPLQVVGSWTVTAP